MPRIELQLKATLENLTNLHPFGDDFRWYLKIRCANCGEETKDFVYLCANETHQIKGSRGSANMVTKCKLCSRENSIGIVKDSIGIYMIEDSNIFKTIVSFECRGVELVDFSPRVGFSAEATGSHTKYEDINLGDRDWAEYDDDGDQSVGIYSLEHRFIPKK
ncbi:CXXC motif containing zinc binding protein-like [Corticium candelabrum]|uniref:CXXC motif containing zinc binding protein-like n=1 Tax=Corticium candelabrum TaxID=121492 RepID=UPI002E2622F4|nr:CXXC motif containing zinc binding protein-like [Corticium candelabrum]